MEYEYIATCIYRCNEQELVEWWLKFQFADDKKCMRANFSNAKFWAR